jgi:tetraspanin-13/31
MAVRLCGFAAIRCCLTLLNVFYIATSLFLIGVVVASRALSYFTSPSILAGLAVCASILFLVAVLGLAGTIKHHQVVLFFYMVLLGVSGIVLFSVSVAALAAPDNYQEDFFTRVWKGLSCHDKTSVQNDFNCCGFDNRSRNIISDGKCEDECDQIGHPSCNTSTLTHEHHCCFIDNSSNITDLICNSSATSLSSLFSERNCTRISECSECDPCYTKWKEAVSNIVWVAGSFGLIFSFTQIIGIILSCRYRNVKDPDVDPRTIL